MLRKRVEIRPFVLNYRERPANFATLAFRESPLLIDQYQQVSLAFAIKNTKYSDNFLNSDEIHDNSTKLSLNRVKKKEASRK